MDAITLLKDLYKEADLLSQRVGICLTQDYKAAIEELEAVEGEVSVNV